MKQTHTQLIKTHLEEHGSITALDAIEQYRCLRLAARIADMRKEGMNIVTNMITKNGATFASYEVK